MAIRFPDRPVNSLAELQRYIFELVSQFGQGAEARLILGVTVGTADTMIAHGLSATPRAVFVMPQDSATVFRSAVPDRKFITLRSSVSVTVDILVVP